jgi:hypothetical protein
MTKEILMLDNGKKGRRMDSEFLQKYKEVGTKAFLSIL